MAKKQEIQETTVLSYNEVVIEASKKESYSSKMLSEISILRGAVECHLAQGISVTVVAEGASSAISYKQDGSKEGNIVIVTSPGTLSEMLKVSERDFVVLAVKVPQQLEVSQQLEVPLVGDKASGEDAAQDGDWILT